MAAKDFTACLKSGSTINITDTDGSLKEVDDSNNDITTITALKNGVDLECYELIEADDNGNYLDGKTPTSIAAGTNGRVVFSQDHKIYCNTFIETD